jgi:hypothetical protein
MLPEQGRLASRATCTGTLQDFTAPGDFIRVVRLKTPALHSVTVGAKAPAAAQHRKALTLAVRRHDTRSPRQ